MKSAIFQKVGNAAVFMNPQWHAVAILFKLSALPVQRHWLVTRNLNSVFRQYTLTDLGSLPISDSSGDNSCHSLLAKKN